MQKHVRSNQMSFFTEELSKEIMTRTTLRNDFLQQAKLR